MDKTVYFIIISIIFIGQCVTVILSQDDAHINTSINQLSIEKKNEENGDVLIQSFGFVHAFVASLSVIIVTELGDKTFFIAVVLAMQHSRCLVFSGALSALGFMTVLSVFLGFATVIIPKTLTYCAGTILLAILGIKMLYDGYKMSPDEGKEEMEATREEINKANEDDVEKGVVNSTPPIRRRIWLLRQLPAVVLQAFTLTFLAEWGDRSQFATIILAAREDPYGVTIGGTIGHALCTALAVIGGQLIAQKISVKNVTLLGGLVFLLFSFTALLHSPDSE